MLRAQFAPGDGAVLVVVEAECVVEVAQGNIPLTLNGRFGDLQAEVAVAGFVGHGRDRKEPSQRKQPPAQRAHGWRLRAGRAECPTGAGHLAPLVR